MYMNPNRVEFDLKPHNEQTIKRILEFYKTSNKCCAIQATGTGKTFLILRLLEIFNDMNKRAVIFAPNNEIIEQTQSKMREFGLDNVCFYTYQKLAKMSERELCEITADLIVCDEMHRTGVKIWGTKFEEFMKYHKDSKLFGATATPVRCSDGKDMAEEYFDGNRACNISLAEALVRGIIPVMPTYVSAMYTFDEECKNMEDKIKRAKNSDEEKKSLLNELKAAKQQLEKSCGVPEIIKKYITKYNGKYVVFCKNKKHLFKMKDVVIKWFRDAGYDGVIYDYAYYSNDIMVRCNYEKFKNNCKDGLKLLFVIEKLNEGVHPKNIDGGILLRTTSSNIIYYQQIGRIIDAGCNEKRVILDLVCNFNNLKSFNLKEEIQEKIIQRRNGDFPDCSSQFEIDQFYINDCIEECMNVFNDIDLKLNTGHNAWDKNEDNIIIEYYPVEGANVKNRLVNRSAQAIRSRALLLGIAYKGMKKWTREEDEILKQFYEIEGSNVHKRLKGRTSTSCTARAKHLDLRTRELSARFSKEEDEIIKKYYLKEGCDVFKRLNNRTRKQCSSRANTLGVSLHNRRWTREEDDILIKYYPTEGFEVCERLNGRNRNAVAGRARKLKLYVIKIAV